MQVYSKNKLDKTAFILVNLLNYMLDTVKNKPDASKKIASG